MPDCKRLKLVCCLLLFYISVFAQPATGMKELTGLWTGLMYNDTTELNYRYEIAISEKNGKLTGYSHTYFILDNKEYYGLKKIRISIDGNKVITQDIKLIANDYPIKPPKGVYVLNVLHFEMKNGVMVLNGMFSTNQTKQYAPATGYIHVEKKTDFMQSAMVPKLETLGLADELTFVAEEKQKEIKTTATTKTAETVKEQPLAKSKPVEKGKTVTDQAAVKIETVKEQPIAKAKPVKEKTIKDQPTKEKVTTVKETAVVNKEPKQTTTPKPAAAGAEINSRIIETIQSVNYSSDSLILTLYDNGEVDGDTVTVFMNGEVIMPRVGLSTNAVRKTIYTNNIADSIFIVMYAENLGSLPPNTGLLIVNDGKERYEIRFSGDLKKNAAIVFRRKQD